MRYIQPQITGTFTAISTIHGGKSAFQDEIGTDVRTPPAAYEADE